MKEIGSRNPNMDLRALGITDFQTAYWNLTPEELIEHTIKKDQGVLADAGALCIETGEFTGRSPADRFIVKDQVTADTVNWGKVNKPFDPDKFDQLYNKITKYFAGKEIYIRDAYACADPSYRLNLRLVSEYPWSNHFAYNMFLRPSVSEIQNFTPEWTILCAPGFRADAQIDGTRQHNFAILNFAKKQVIIGGTGYTGEIKKGIFSVLNYVLPVDHNVLSMHCSANVGKNGDTAVFFGLSGTGKTTLSADPERYLIGDDEHGWSNNGVFNFEGGCYAKCIDLTPEKEPDIYRAIRHNAILENIRFFKGTRKPDYSNSDITENTRVSYPIYHIDNALPESKGGIPTNIFFLTCDASGILPPISKLTPGQAMYHFISGYTAKVAGTEEGIKEPQLTFSACFGAPFLPLHPAQYAEMFGKKMQEHNVKVWLINTGWSGGEYGVGSRIKLGFTRAMITAALEGKLDSVAYTKHKVFGLQMPITCPGVPDEILNPSNTWDDQAHYYQKAQALAKAFNDNFKQYASEASPEILAAAPVENVFV